MTTDNYLTAGPRMTTHHLTIHDPAVVSLAGVLPGRVTTRSFTARHWLHRLRDLRRGLTRARTARRRQPARRGDYMERAAMAREMHRL